MKLTRLAGLEDSSDLEACLATLDPDAPADSRELAGILALDWRATRPRWVGLAGGQGVGKSTVGGLLEAACAQVGLRTCVLGIDDFYRTKLERIALARRVHPLLETRGPPGTHDLALCRKVMQRLATATACEIPCFDKGLDDRVEPRLVTGPFDLIVLEGWCVGARARREADLDEPINELEAHEDRDGVWRRHVNDALRETYQPLWRELDQIVFLEVPDMNAVRRWRLLQEQGLPEARRLGAKAIERFVAHYERVTLDMLELLPDEADWNVRFGPDHSVLGLQRRAR